MNAQQIKEILRLVRFSLFAMYGQQKFELIAFQDLEIRSGLWTGWLEVRRKNTKKRYVIRLEDDDIMTIMEGRLNDLS